MTPDNVYQLKGDNIGGWISPEGLFFRAFYYEHDNVARQIVEKFLKEYTIYYHSDWLIRLGWIRLETSGSIMRDMSQDTTGQQAGILHYLYTVSTSNWYKEALEVHITSIVLECTREPRQPVPPQGDQENWHRKGVHV